MRDEPRGPRDCLPPGSAIHVHKLRADGSEVFAWEGVVLQCDHAGIVLRATFNIPQTDLGFATLRKGDIFVEFYYWDRWYNVFEIRDAEGRFKGWYANVGAPAQLEAARGRLSYVDLALDLWCDPTGAIQLLDEEEFAEETAKGTFGADLVAGAERGWRELVELAQAGALPQWNAQRAA